MQQVQPLKKQKQEQAKKAPQRIVHQHKFQDADHVLPSNYTEEQQKEFFHHVEIHTLASRVGDEIPKPADSPYPDVCPCCGRYVHKQILPISCNPTELDFLGPGYPLFFSFIKYCGIFLLILMLSAGSYNFFSNSIDPDCVEPKEGEENHCPLTWVSRFSLPNKRHDQNLNDLQMVLNLFSIGALIILLQVFRTQQREVTEKCDSGDINPTDYSILLKDLPVGEKAQSKEQILKTLNEKLQAKYGNEHEQITMDRCNFSFNHELLPFNDCEQEKTQLIADYQKKLSAYYKTHPGSDFQLRQQEPLEGEKEIIEKIQQVQSKIEKEQKEFAQTGHPEIFNGLVFVSLNTEQYKERILQDFHKMQWDQDTEIKIIQAPDPTDVYWENLHFKTTEKYLRRFASFLINAVTLFLCFIVIFYLSQKQYQLTKQINPDYTDVCKTQHKPAASTTTSTDNTKTIDSGYILHNHYEQLQVDQSVQQPLTDQYNAEMFLFDELIGTSDYLSDAQTIKMITMLISLVVIPTFNAVLLQVMTRTTILEKYSTRTEHQISLASKLTFGMFFNTAIQTFLIKIVIRWYDECLESAREAIFQEGGLIYTQNSVLMMTAIQAPIIYAIDSAKIMKYAYKWYYLIFNKNQCVLTQKVANDYNEQALQIIAPRYAFVLSTMFTTAFYAPLLPIGLVYTMIGLFFTYWIEKYKILRERVIDFNLSEKLSTEMTEILELFLPIYCFANLIFEYMIVKTKDEHPDVQTSHPIIDMFMISSFYAQLGIFVGILHAVLPMKAINQFLIPTTVSQSNQHTYLEALPYFDTNYELVNPATSEYATEQKFKRVSLNKV